MKIIDFGLAWAKNKNFKTRVGVVKGKLAYLSPEQALGAEVDRRTDVFALAVTLWELSTDRRLFRVEDDNETLERVIAGVVPNPLELVEGYPPALWNILQRGLEHDRQQALPDCGPSFLSLSIPSAGCKPEPVTPATVEDILEALFPEEKAANVDWLAKAEAGGPQVVATTMRPAASREDRDMPEMPAPPSVPFDLPLGDFAPPSLPILPSTEHVPISSSRSSEGGAASMSVPFEYIKPVTIDDAPALDPPRCGGARRQQRGGSARRSAPLGAAGSTGALGRAGSPGCGPRDGQAPPDLRPGWRFWSRSCWWR